MPFFQNIFDHIHLSLCQYLARHCLTVENTLSTILYDCIGINIEKITYRYAHFLYIGVKLNAVYVFISYKTIYCAAFECCLRLICRQTH